jgi:hypothetical protein
VNDLTVVTGNVRHFSRVPRLRVENWLTQIAGIRQGLTTMRGVAGDSTAAHVSGPGWSRTTARSFEGCRSIR